MFRRHFIATLVGGASAGLCLTSASQSLKPAAPSILVVGDSLSAEYGLKRGTGWVARLNQRLIELNKNFKVINASISGDTTSGGVSRLPELMALHRPSHVIIELGGNDALRGLPMALTQSNLDQMTQISLKAGSRVLLLGMEVPPNYGQAYSNQFKTLFKTVASKNKVSYLPFFLKGVADIPESARFFQADRIHPNEDAQSIMLENVWTELKKILP